MLTRLTTLFRNPERGDTIVEVLIAIAIISLIIGGAYVTTNKSLLATRGSQERSNAVKLTEAQLEQLKGAIAKNSASVFGGGVPSPFCVYNDVATSTLQVVASSDARCRVNTAGVPTTAEPSFRLSITRVNNDFTVKNDWANVSGKTTDHIQIKYRAYQ